MKKMLIAAVAVISVIASIVGCQVYDSQTNKPLASGMNSADEGNSLVQWSQLEKEFNKACNDYYDNSTDENLKVIAEKYLAFDKFYTAALVNVKTYNMNATTKVDVYDTEAVKECYIAQYMAPSKPYDLYAFIKTYKAKYEKKLTDDKTAALAKVTGDTNKLTGIANAKDQENKAKIDDYKKQIEDEYTVEADEYPYVDMDVSTDVKTTWSISGLYSEEYKLKWDYNNKK